jgi:cytochrome c-type biogenesis protein
MKSADLNYILAFGFGLASFLTPCVLPLIPSYLTYITGISFAELKDDHPSRLVRKHTVIHSLLFIAGFTTVFMAIAASLSFFGGFFQGNAALIRKIGGALVIVFGIHLTGLVHVGALLKEKKITIHRKPAGYLGTYIVGLAFAVGWTPCTGPSLGTIITIATTEGRVLYGMSLLLAYSMGLGVPFFLSALSLSTFLAFFNRYKKYIRLFEIVTGFLLIIVGILIFTNYLSQIFELPGVFFNGR